MKKNKLIIYEIKEEYTEFLRKYENKIGEKEKRPYVGVVLEVNNKKYYAPMSSPKEKYKNINDRKRVDIYKIANGKYGVINLNNMMPIVDDAIIKIDVENHKDGELFKNQIKDINSNKKKIIKKAERLHKIIKSNAPAEGLRKRCCNFELLEEKSKQWKKGDEKKLRRFIMV